MRSRFWRAGSVSDRRTRRLRSLTLPARQNGSRTPRRCPVGPWRFRAGGNSRISRFARDSNANYSGVANEAASFGDGFREQAKYPARITTPFILERANHARAWDAKRQLWPGLPNQRAAFPKGWPRRHHRPSRDSRRQDAARSRPDPGTGLPVMFGLAPLLPPPLSAGDFFCAALVGHPLSLHRVKLRAAAKATQSR